MRARSIIILGGGIFGITTAREMRARGWQVSVLDQGRMPHPDAASTDISKVVRMDYGEDEIYTEMGEQSLDGWCVVAAALPRGRFSRDDALDGDAAGRAAGNSSAMASRGSSTISLTMRARRTMPQPGNPNA